MRFFEMHWKKHHSGVAMPATLKKSIEITDAERRYFTEGPPQRKKAKQSKGKGKAKAKAKPGDGGAAAVRAETGAGAGAGVHR